MTGQNLTRLTARDPMLHLFLRFGQTLRRHTRHLCSFQGCFGAERIGILKQIPPRVHRERQPGSTPCPLAQLP